MTNEELLALASDCGFDHVGLLCVEKLVLDPKVRDMCAADKCRSYGKSWSCPPACGSLEEIGRAIAPYRRGLLLQCTGQMEDDFDFEVTQETEERLKAAFDRCVDTLRPHFPNCYPMSAGTCTRCRPCAYPGPCRFPEQLYPSMEACGLFVSKVCEDSGMRYYYGPRTITFSCCVLTD